MSSEEHEGDCGLACNSTETGICALHNVEIERRRHSDKTVDEHEIQIGALFKRASIFSTFIGQAKVVLLVAGAIWAGSFVYTYDHKQDSIREFDAFRQELMSLKRDMDRSYTRISELESDSRVNAQKFSQLSDLIGTNNRRLSDLIERLSDHKPFIPSIP